MQYQFNHSERIYQINTQVFLKHPNELNPKYLGVLVGGVFSPSLNPDTKVHLESNSVGFNFEFIRDGIFRYVCLLIDSKEFWTLREFILAHGFFLQHTTQDYDQQIFLQLSQFGTERARKWYDRRKIREAWDIECQRSKGTNLVDLIINRQPSYI